MNNKNNNKFRYFVRVSMYTYDVKVNTIFTPLVKLTIAHRTNNSNVILGGCATTRDMSTPNSVDFKTTSGRFDWCNGFVSVKWLITLLDRIFVDRLTLTD